MEDSAVMDWTEVFFIVWTIACIALFFYEGFIKVKRRGPPRL